MRRPAPLLAVAVLTTLLVQSGAVAAKNAARATRALDALAAVVSSARDYTVTIEAHESDGATSDDRTLRFWYRKPDRAKIQVLRGKGAGIRLIWTGGTTVRVRGGMFSLVPLKLDLHDPRLLSLRGNTMLRAEFAPTLACFTSHRDAVSERPAARAEGRSIVLIALDRSTGFWCPGDSLKDRTVTKDVLTVDGAGRVVLRRERSIGDEVVERWILRDLKYNAGLTDADFR